MEERVTDNKFELQMYTHDLAPLPKEAELIFNTKPDLAVRPKTTEEVQTTVRRAIRERMPLIPRGAGTWGLGGSIPVKGGIVLDMSTMNEVIEIDEENMCVTVQAGITWEKLYDTLLKKGYFLGAYPTSAPAATVGGWINTGGIGVGTYKYGSAGDLIRSMEVVLPNCDEIETGFKSVLSNSTGYNLTQLFVGSEGTLGIVTTVTLKIYPAPDEIRPVSYSFSDLKDMGRALQDIVKSKVTPLHIGYGDRFHYEFLRKIGKDVPEVGALLNIALEGAKEVIDYEERTIDSMMEKSGGKKESNEVALHEWNERSYEYRIRQAGITTLPAEILIPLPKFSDVIDKTRKLIESMKLNAGIIGMVGDRNTVMVMPYYLIDEKDKIKSITAMGFVEEVGDIAFSVGGHPVGLGLFFASNLDKMHGIAGAELIRTLKRAVDDMNIMNPGKLTEIGTKGEGFSIPPPVMSVGMTLLGCIKRILSKDEYSSILKKRR